MVVSPNHWLKRKQRKQDYKGDKIELTQKLRPNMENINRQNRILVPQHINCC